jgi:hypothetical protein
MHHRRTWWLSLALWNTVLLLNLYAALTINDQRSWLLVGITALAFATFFWMHSSRP